VLALLISLVLALGTIGQPCNSDTDCINGTPSGLGHCSTPIRCEAPAAIYRTYFPAMSH
jgi:hypothetical protein